MKIGTCVNSKKKRKWEEKEDKKSKLKKNRRRRRKMSITKITFGFQKGWVRSLRVSLTRRIDLKEYLGRTSFVG